MSEQEKRPQENNGREGWIKKLDDLKPGGRYLLHFSTGLPPQTVTLLERSRIIGEYPKPRKALTVRVEDRRLSGGDVDSERLIIQVPVSLVAYAINQHGYNEGGMWFSRLDEESSEES